MKLTAWSGRCWSYCSGRGSRWKLILRHQLNIQRRHVPKRVAFSAMDRLIFVGLYRLVPNAIKALTIVEPDTVIHWHRAGFRSYCAGNPGTAAADQLYCWNSAADPRDAHRQPVWGAPRIHGGASQAWHRDRPDQRRQVYGAEERPSVAGMEDVPSQSCGWHCRNGRLRRADNLVPDCSMVC
jgi:hypothetical protein